jgi:hypothetical protein
MRNRSPGQRYRFRCHPGLGRENPGTIAPRYQAGNATLRQLIEGAVKAPARGVR